MPFRLEPPCCSTLDSRPGDPLALEVRIGEFARSMQLLRADRRRGVFIRALVPRGYTGDATETIIAQLERFAPGFRERIVGTAAQAAARCFGGRVRSARWRAGSCSPTRRV
ncbi:hypothetical protein FDZ84_36960 [Saccharopolyspora sp. ASAGF58]|nr:hypothetical protein FDZ84_36960 [Saccharopolyspora sp. ASAGF58]